MPEGPSDKAARRQLTVLFSDLTDSTGLVASMESEDYAEILSQLMRIVEEIIPRHGGHIVQVRGDGSLAVFGLQAREDESRHATEAALDLHQAVKQIPCPTLPGKTLAMHSGIHSGLVLLVEGDAVYGQYILAGEPPHIASRLSDQARADEILVSADSLGSDRHFFRTSPPRRLPLKGVTSDLMVYAVNGRTEVHTRYETRRLLGLTPFVGRARELGFLRSAFTECATGKLLHVAVVAPAGTGKTRLVEEFLDSLGDQDFLVLRGFCEKQHKAEPLQPALQMLQQLCAVVPPLSPSNTDWHDIRTNLLAISPRLEVYLDVLVQALDHRSPSEAQLQESLLALCESLALRSTLVLFCDDWQWADDSMRRFYSAIGELRHRPILLLTTSRRCNAGDNLNILDLQPLPPQHSSQLIAELIPASSPFLSAKIERASGGNPLYLEELCHSVKNSGDEAHLYFEGKHDSKQVPNYLKMLVESRVTSLPARQLQLVRSAAVIGTVIPIWLLREISGQPATEIEQLVNLDLLFSDTTEGTLRFKHGITRELIYYSVGLHERRQLHRTIAEALEAHYGDRAGASISAMLSYHYGETTVFDRAAQYAEIAGDTAMDAAALDRARLHYQAALTALDQMGEKHYARWMSVAQRLAMACLYDANYDQLGVYQRALQLARARDDIANITQAEYRLAYINYALGEGPASLRHCQLALQAVGQLDAKPFAVQITATLGQTLAINGRYDEALPTLEDVLSKQRPFKTKARIAPAFAYTLAARAMILGDRGRFAEAYECFDEADELIKGSTHQIQISAVSMRAGVYLWQGQWEDAVEYADRTASIANRIGSHYMYAMGLALRGYALWHLEEERGAAQLRKGVEWIEAQGQALWTSLHYGWLTEVLTELGEYSLARHYAAKTLDRTRKGERLGEAVACCALAAAPEGRRAPEHYYRRARRSADKRGSPREHALITLQEARREIKRGGSAHDLLSSCRHDFNAMGMSWYAACAQSLQQALKTPA